MLRVPQGVTESGLNCLSIRDENRIGHKCPVFRQNPPANAGVAGEAGSIPGLERFPGGGHGSPLEYSCLENPMDRGAWWATVHMVAKSQT